MEQWECLLKQLENNCKEIGKTIQKLLERDWKGECYLSAFGKQLEDGWKAFENQFECNWAVIGMLLECG